MMSSRTGSFAHFSDAVPLSMTETAGRFGVFLPYWTFWTGN